MGKTQRQVDGSTIRRSMINRDIHLNNVLFPRRRSNNKIIINNRFPLAEWNARRTKQKLITEKEAKRKKNCGRFIIFVFPLRRANSMFLIFGFAVAVVVVVAHRI